MDSQKNQYKVIISEKAADLLKQHVFFLSKVSEEAANKLREEIISAIKSLEVLPERNPWLINPFLPAYKYRKMLISNRYLILYQVKAEFIYIDVIVDCRQDYHWLI
ncbi:type II toxin-antitoxin system RelE/ParE family toxin [Chungangia koreensis]|uniref:Type II toxin-antitoxin system RelE/ParE family toxin n=1 Tax=Chungangia koreensis TaxID=752657 RepID=A0ABV8X0L5_9LACT